MGDFIICLLESQILSLIAKIVCTSREYKHNKEIAKVVDKYLRQLEIVERIYGRDYK